MSTKKSTTEELFLKIFKVVILIVMTLALVATAGALAFAAYQFTQSPKAIAPAQKAPVKSVAIDEFLKTLASEDPVKEAPKVDEPPSVPAVTPEPVKYKAEASKIMGCFQESNQSAGIALSELAAAAGEDFRKQLQEVADLKSKDRGQPFVTDAAKLTCEMMLHAKVIEHRKAKPEAEIFFPVLNFHMNAWDDLKEAAREYDAKEQERVNQETRHEQMRVAGSKEAAKVTLLAAAGAFGLFMAIAITLIVAAIESILRRISLSFEAFNEAQAKEVQLPVKDDTPSPDWPDLNVTSPPLAPTPQA
jgi:hypothetical protein